VRGLRSCSQAAIWRDDEALSLLCHEHTARLLAWVADHRAEGGPRFTRYDGTMISACRVYQEHPYSRFHKVKYNTRKSYTHSLKIIEAAVGKRLIRNATALDVQHWYDEWRKPSVKGAPSALIALMTRCAW
jgi:hypothetical protein